jgi:hypothetical protein
MVNRVSRTNTGWEAGCTFTPALTEEQLAALLSSIDEAGVGASPSTAGVPVVGQIDFDDRPGKLPQRIPGE